MLYQDLIDTNDDLLTQSGPIDKITSAEVRESMRNVSDFMYKNMKRRRWVQDYAPGVDLECRQALACTMAAGSNVVTAASGAFETGIVGKKILVSNCGASGNDLLATVTGRTNDYTITLDTAADASAPAHDRVIYWGHDASTYAQTLLNDIKSSRRGIMQVEGMMVLAGGLVGTSLGDSATYNCQLAIPTQHYTDAKRGAYHIEGSTSLCYSDNGPGNVGFTRPSMEADGFVSFLTTSTDNAAVIGTGGIGGYPFNYTNIKIKNIKVLVPTNGTGVGAGIGGINMRYAANCQMEECIANITDNLRYSAYPTYGHIGFEGNDIYTDASNYHKLLNAYAFKSGFRLASEHVTFDNLQAYGCYDAMQVKEGLFTLVGRQLIMHWGKNGIRIIGGDQLRKLFIVGYEVETVSIDYHPITLAASWALPNTLGLYIDDSVNQRAEGVIYGGWCSGNIEIGTSDAQVGANMRIMTMGQYATTLPQFF